ncbi:MAG TPA: hypothetical protein PKI14_10020 [Fervidobacterium sp.]|nr:hypothetical protein [Fervidobacterium sp.]
MANNKEYSLEEALKALGKDIEDMAEATIKEAHREMEMVAMQAHGLIVEKATQKMRSTRQMYLDALGIEHVGGNGGQDIWSITLKKSAAFLEDGKEAHNALQYFLNSPKAKTAKDGGKYLVIPFKHNKGPTQNSAAQQRVTNFVNRELKAKGLDKIQTDSNGKAIIGKVATVKIDNPKQPTNRFNQPILKGLTIYQREVKTKSGKTQIKRDVMTFRVASSKQEGQSLWDLPPRQGLHAFDETAKEIDLIWDKIVQSLAARMG